MRNMLLSNYKFYEPEQAVNTTIPIVSNGNTPASGKGIVANGNIYYVSDNGVIGEYNASTGTAINGNLITGLANNVLLGIWGNNLFAYSGNNINEYNATTGAVINSSFITGLSGRSFLSENTLTVLGNNLYVSESAAGIVGEYDARTGATINANFITGFDGNLAGIATDGHNLFVEDEETIGEYNAQTGAAINSSFISGLP